MIIGTGVLVVAVQTAMNVIMAPQSGRNTLDIPFYDPTIPSKMMPPAPAITTTPHLTSDGDSSSTAMVAANPAVAGTLPL